MKRHLGGFGLVTLMIVVLAVPAGAQVVFTDVTEEVGIALTDQLIESVAWGDYDDDGDQDLYLTGDGPNHLFRNDGDGRFTDVTAAAGVGHSGFSVGTAFGDLDNDGDLDLYVVNFQDGPDVLYRNDGPTGVNGAYKFTDITVSAGTRLERSSRGMAFVDYDRDGLLDIFVMAIGPNILYHNDGGLRFHDVARELGVDQDDQGVGVVAVGRCCRGGYRRQRMARSFHWEPQLELEQSLPQRRGHLHRLRANGRTHSSWAGHGRSGVRRRQRPRL
jgi:hypothetical protein